jgi:small-conductance mechanosensitive channel
LVALEDDAAVTDLHNATEIESMPLAAVKKQLAELKIGSSLPNYLREMIEVSAPSPAATLFNRLTDNETRDSQQWAADHPLSEVTAELDRLGINHRAGLTEIVAYVNEYVSTVRKSKEEEPDLALLSGTPLLLLPVSLLVVVGLYLAGADLPSLSILSGVVMAAVTIALKDILQNVISGMWLVWEGTVKKGDVIQLSGNQIGWVSRITLGYTVIKDWNGMHTLIPNTVLMSGTLKNWTLGKREDNSSRIRLNIDVRVAFGTDVDNAITRLAEAARRAERVLRQPAPQALLAGVGDSAINLKLKFWISDPEKGITNILSEVYLEVLDEFACDDPHKIIIPFPQSAVREIDDGTSTATAVVKLPSANLRTRRKM